VPEVSRFFGIIIVFYYNDHTPPHFHAKQGIRSKGSNPWSSHMIPRVTKAKYVAGYEIWIQFSDGKAGVVNLSDELWGPMFEPLRDLDAFRQVRVHPEMETLSWPNGADFAPEFLYERVAGQLLVGS
jgi:hypothetical protein